MANIKWVLATLKFEIGKSYLVYAYKLEGGDLETNQCTQTNELSEVERDSKVLGKSKVPKKTKT